MGVKIRLTVRDEHRVKIFKNGVLKIFGPKGNGVTGEWKDYITSSNMIMLPHKI